MSAIDTRNFLKWTSIAIQMENPEYSKSDCMKFAIIELKTEKLKRDFIRSRSIQIRKFNRCVTVSASIKMALAEWKAM
jgi:hypothetical protein